MPDDLSRKLRRLGVSKGARRLKPAPPVKPESTQPPLPPSQKDEDHFSTAHDEHQAPLTFEEIFPGGQSLDTAAGPCFVIDHVLPLTHQHGKHRIGDLIEVDLTLMGQLVSDPRLGDFKPTDLLFLDIETRGLMQSGAEVIQIGLGFLEENSFVVRLLFARDLSEEGALLAEVDRLVSRHPVLVTFNGKSFDLRFLDGRAIMNRLFYAGGDLIEQPHIDLLGPARRLWRHLPSVALSKLDAQILQVRRSGHDIPGWQVPVLYNRYLVDRDPRPLKGILEHNRYDILAMVSLLIELQSIWSRPEQLDDDDLLFNLARQQVATGQDRTAEQLFQQLVKRQKEPQQRIILLKEYTLFLKRRERRAEAVPFWQEMVTLEEHSIFPHIELAKYYEWHQIELQTAAEWAAHAYQIVISQRFVDEIVKQEVEHRLIRLSQKRSKT